MKTVYSLIKIVPNEMSGDSLTIGIILSSPDGVRLKISKTKKVFAKSIVNIDGSLIDFIEREIISKVKEQNKILLSSKNSLFENSTFLSSEYFQYLAKYSNGLLKFTEPSFIADNVDDSKFLKLFSLFVDNSLETGTKKDDSIKKYGKEFYNKVNTNLIEKVKDKVHTRESISRKVVPTLSNPFEMDCIGQNGVLIGAKSLPFIQSKETIYKSINTYISVIAHLSATYQQSLENNKFFLIADQPAKSSPTFNLWNDLYEHDNIVKVISSDDSGEVAELIEKSGASKFIK